MVETTLNRMLYCLFVFALFCGTSFAQSAAPAIAHTTHSGIVTPAQPTPATLKTIFTNLGPSKTDDYNDTAGLYIMGPTNSFGDSEQADAVPFTPKSNSHVTQLQVAVGPRRLWWACIATPPGQRVRCWQAGVQPASRISGRAAPWSW